MAAKRGLGRGLDAIFESNVTEASESSAEVRISEIEPDRQQPRKNFDQDTLHELAESISEHGVLQPILLRPLAEGRYRIVAGERRFRAAHLAGLSKIPAIVRDFSEQQAIEAALVENLQREDLNPLEEAKGYQKLIEHAGLTQEEAAKRVGKSRSGVANVLRLLSLPPHTRDLLSTGAITVGHAKALLSFPFDNIDELADRIVTESLSVREIEKIGQTESRQKTAPVPKTKDSTASEVEISLREALGVEVRVKYSEGSGTLSVDFYTKEQLFEFANKLGGES